MKKKVFFILSSLRAGGAERVFWLISHHFNKQKYEVKIVILNSKNRFFWDNGSVEVVDLKTIKASKSLLVICKFLRNEKPYAVFTTGGQVDILLAVASWFVRIPFLIARSTSIPGERIKFASGKSRFLGKIFNFFDFYKRFNNVVCQTDEMKNAWESRQNIDAEKLVVISNPVAVTTVEKSSVADERTEVKLITVGTLSEVKGHDRLLDIFKLLPGNYSLNIVGGGALQKELSRKIRTLGIGSRVNLLGQASNVLEIMAYQDIFVLTSFVEGFPNVALEALSVGLPVIAFKVSGISELIVDGFNGYIVDQGDIEGFKERVLSAGNRYWDHQLIRQDVYSRFAIDPIVAKYENLIKNIE